MSKENEWPEGATHKINGSFVKWIDGLEYLFVNGTWHISINPWSLDAYLMADSFDVTERPVKEPKFIPEAGEWCEVLRIHTEPYKAFYIGRDNDGYHIVKARGELESLASKVKFRPIKSERDVLIEIIMATIKRSEGEMADAILTAFEAKKSARFNDE